MIGLRRENSPLIGWKEVLGVCYGWTWDVVLVAKFNDFSKSMLLVLDFSVNCPLRSVSQQGLFFCLPLNIRQQFHVCVCDMRKFFSIRVHFLPKSLWKSFMSLQKVCRLYWCKKIWDELLFLSGILRKIKIVPLKFSQLVFTKQSKKQSKKAKYPPWCLKKSLVLSSPSPNKPKSSK